MWVVPTVVRRKSSDLGSLSFFYQRASDNKIIQGDLTETKWLLDNHTTRSYVRSPNYQRNSAIYQKRSYDGMKKLESFQSHHQ